MLMDFLRVIINNPFKENFMEKLKKKQLIFWQFFSFPIKVISKLSLTGFLTSALKALVSMTLVIITIRAM